jgi:hypothetical protein
MLREQAEKNLTADELKSKLLARDCDGRNTWQWVAELGRVKVLLKQWEWAKRKLTTEEINDEILLATDNGRKAMWHMAAGMKKGDMLWEIWVWDKEVVTTEEVRNSVFFHSGNMDISFWYSSSVVAWSCYWKYGSGLKGN